MKNNLKQFFALAWAILTDVPGWPDAPRKLRLRRLIPILLPFSAILLILLWNVAWRNPKAQAERAAFRPVEALDAEVTSLRLAYSDQQTADIAAQAQQSAAVLLASPADLPPLLEKLKAAARSYGWDATLIPAVTPNPPAPGEAPFYFLPARGKLVPSANTTEPFASLLAFLEKLPASDKWIDLMRLSVRADDQGRLSVEIHLRAGCRVPNEKTAQ